MWHRIPIPDLLIAEMALHHDLGVVHVDRDYDHIAEVRPLKGAPLAPWPFRRPPSRGWPEPAMRDA